MRLNRRAFIQASSAASGLWLLGCASTPPQVSFPISSAMQVRRAKPAAAPVGEWVASTCQGCTQWCAIQLFMQGGRTTRVRGNPLSKTNHGYCCPRGHLIPQQAYDPDRVRVPMPRVRRRSDSSVVATPR